MIIIDNQDDMAAILAAPITSTVRRILLLRGDLIELASFIIPEPGDPWLAIEAAVGLSLADSFEWVLDHGGAYEAPYILSDDGSGVLLIVPDSEGINAALLALLRSHADEAEAAE